MTDYTSEIPAWFIEHDDGEFVRLPVTHPYSITAPPLGMRHMLYTTKPACILAAMEKEGRHTPIQVVGRAGLPNDDDAAWLRGLAGDRPVMFLGDADPADLLVFAWLRAQMPISYVGVSDVLIRRLGVQVEESHTMSVSPSERAAMSLLAEVFPEYRRATGDMCSALLDQGRKIEMEAVVNSAPARPGLGEALVG